MLNCQKPGKKKKGILQRYVILLVKKRKTGLRSETKVNKGKTMLQKLLVNYSLGIT